MTQPPTYPPGAPLNYASPRTCPGCGGGPLEEPSFTIWGGVIGHKILGVERCTSCKKWWVKKTGAPGGTRILVYLIAGIILGVLLAVSFIGVRS